jgi:hypothetical protein
VALSFLPLTIFPTKVLPTLGPIRGKLRELRTRFADEHYREEAMRKATNWIAKLRQEKGFSQGQLAARVGMRAPNISRIETDPMQNLTLYRGYIVSARLRLWSRTCDLA